MDWFWPFDAGVTKGAADNFAGVDLAARGSVIYALEADVALRPILAEDACLALTER